MQVISSKTNAVEKLLPGEPAKKNYFLEKGFSDLWATIKDSFKLNAQSAKKNFKAIGANGKGGRIRRLAGALMRLFAIVSTFVFGTIITTVFSLIHIIVLSVIMAVVYLAFGVSRLVDNVYIGIHKISVVCDKCKIKTTLPGYKCPTCGSVHYRLRPNVYGILLHKCNCGQKLPATFFLKTKNNLSGQKQSRSQLPALCANPNCASQVYAAESRPICIPIAGSRSVGKTAYLTAVSYELIENILPSNGVEVQFYTAEKMIQYADIASNFAAGKTSMTIEPANTQQPSAFSLSYFVNHQSLKPRRLFHMFDISGEAFVGNSEHERQLHYAYSNGVILIIDPFCIPDIKGQFEDNLNNIDKLACATEDIDAVAAALVAKMQNVNMLATGKKIDIALAVVINKIDEPGVCDYFDSQAQNEFSAKNSCGSNDANHLMCRQFLLNHSMGNFVNTVEVNFKTVRYFSASAIGHSREDGTYAPCGVIEPIRWITSLTDKSFSKLLDAKIQNSNTCGGAS